MSKKTITLGELLDNIEKNGLPKITGFFFDYENHGRGDIARDRKVVAACAMGMGIINLGVKEPDSWEADQDNDNIFDWVERIESLNDTTTMTFAQIAQRVREEAKDDLNLSITVDEYKYIV